MLKYFGFTKATKVRHTLIIYFLIASLLNGAMFNRIGNRIAERSYITHVISFVLVQFGFDQLNKDKIRIAKRYVPTNNNGGNVTVKIQSNIDNETHSHYRFTGILISKQFFSAPYAAQISEAHKPPIFKPPS